MSVRSYLSIGDVLTLLRQEFPDVTISKIRFLESQGLVNPERTPSGYRKFYEHDVERLRWVLRQQRENFLPLKVIKDRLDDEQADDGSTVPADGARSESAPSDAALSHTARAADGDEPVLVGQGATGEQRAVTTHRSSPTRGARGGAVASRSIGTARAVRGDGPPGPDGVTLPGIETETPAPNGGAPAGAGSSGNGSTPVATGTQDSAVPDAEAAAPPAGPVAGAAPETPPVTPPSRSPGRSRQPAAGQAGSAGRAGGEADPSDPSAVSSPATVAGDGPEPVASAPVGRSAPTLSIDQVAAGSGLDVAVVEELVSYGLVVSTSVAGLECFDEEAVAVATLAAGFARFGIEPRHLRLYKNAADREAGFIEQIVLPLIRQRNPDARVRANETADELARLGQQLRSSLVRSALGGLLDG